MRMGLCLSTQYQASCDDLTARLLDWRDPVYGGPVVRRVWQREDLYSGPCVAMAPDLVLDLATPGGYSYVGLPSYGQAGPAIERSTRRRSAAAS